MGEEASGDAFTPRERRETLQGGCIHCCAQAYICILRLVWRPLFKSYTWTTGKAWSCNLLLPTKFGLASTEEHSTRHWLNFYVFGIELLLRCSSADARSWAARLSEGNTKYSIVCAQSVNTGNLRLFRVKKVPMPQTFSIHRSASIHGTLFEQRVSINEITNATANAINMHRHHSS